MIFKKKYKSIAGAALICASCTNIVNVAYAVDKMSSVDVKLILAPVGSTPDVMSGIQRLAGQNPRWVTTPNTSKEMLGDNKFLGKVVEYDAKVDLDDGTSQTFKIPVRVCSTLAEGMEEMSRETNEKLSIEPSQIRPFVLSLGSSKLTLSDIKFHLSNAKASKLEILENVDTNREGRQSVKIRATFPSGKTQEFTMPVEIISKKKLDNQVENFKKELEKKKQEEYLQTLSPNDRKIAEKIGLKNITSEVIKQGEKIDLSNNIYNLPKGSKVNVLSTPSNDKVGKFEGLVEVILPDGDKLNVKIPVEVLEKDSVIDTSKNNNNPDIKSALEYDQNNNQNNNISPEKREVLEAQLRDDPNANAKFIKGEAIKGEKVKTGEVAKKGVIASLAVASAFAASVIYYLKKSKK